MDKITLQEKINHYQQALDALIDVHDLYKEDKYRETINGLRTDIANLETD